MQITKPYHHQEIPSHTKFLHMERNLHLCGTFKKPHVAHEDRHILNENLELEVSFAVQENPDISVFVNWPKNKKQQRTQLIKFHENINLNLMFQEEYMARKSMNSNRSGVRPIFYF